MHYSVRDLCNTNHCNTIILEFSLALKNTLNTPIYNMDMEDGTLGMATKNGSILVNREMSPAQQENTINHESVHLQDIKDYRASDGIKGLDYNDNELIYNGKSYARKDGKIKYEGEWKDEGWPGFIWEQKAYNNS